MTTEINIDYYEELKAKADKWVEKETLFKPVDLFSNSFGDIFGKCKCKSKVSVDENYCYNCGQKLDWSE